MPRSASRRTLRSASAALIWALLFAVTSACALDEPKIAEAASPLEDSRGRDVAVPDPSETPKEPAGNESEPSDPPTVVCAARSEAGGRLEPGGDEHTKVRRAGSAPRRGAAVPSFSWRFASLPTLNQS